MDVDSALEQVRSDATLRASLRAARAWGVSPSRFGGREPARRIVLDALGRPVRVEPEPEWTDDDRALALALVVVEADTCSGCGHPLSETTRPEDDLGGVYVSPLPTRCHACTAIEQRAEASRSTAQAGALRFSAEFHRTPTDDDLAALVDEQTPAG